MGGLEQGISNPYDFFGLSHVAMDFKFIDELYFE